MCQKPDNSIHTHSNNKTVQYSCYAQFQTECETSLSCSSQSGSVSSQDQECTSECCKYSSVVRPPYQVKESTYSSSNQKLQGSKWRQFSSGWYDTYSWLVPCTTTLKAYCHFCKCCTKGGLLSDKHVDSAL